MIKKDWFEEWFDTKYYHSLYQNRNEAEAELFIQNLVNKLDISHSNFVIDLACGKGRHSITLNKLGYKVLGLDLSKNSIETAKKFENENLKFAIHDMRDPLNCPKAEVVFNLFTSFGYFETLEENQRVLASVYQILNEKGLFVIDFMNSHKSIKNLITSENKTIESINYNISREYTGSHIIKHIQFEDLGKKYHFTEKVQVLKLNDFKEMLSQNHFQIIRTFGDFNLNEFDELNSDRLIIIARKK
ncbi:MAG: class I SAM-dependent methyltransferase [Flavobacteriia bacterium]|nr:class I SAM-dependent methyltransferase [Flavobacteriia bacterium]